MWTVDKLHKTIHKQEHYILFTNPNYYRKQVHGNSLLLVNHPEQRDSALTSIIHGTHAKSRLGLKGFKRVYTETRLIWETHVLKEKMTGRNSAFVLKDMISYKH